MQDTPPDSHESAETLRERQRLQQLATFDKWIEGTLTEQRRARRWKLFFRFAFFMIIVVSLINSMYFFHVTMGDSEESPGLHVGIIKVKGVIDAGSEASASRINEALRRAMDSVNTAAVVLQINSPGGSPVQSQRIYDEIRLLASVNDDKPIYAVIEDIGASGAYYVASAADEIYASPASLVGSIGVISAGFGLGDAIERFGVERRVFTAGENKAFLDPFKPVSPEERSYWQGVLNSTHQQFIADVKQGRGERLAKDDRLFSGLVWTGEQAVGLGLIDGLKTVDQISRELLGEVSLQDYTPRLNPFQRVAKRLGVAFQQSLGIAASGSPIRAQMY